MYNSFIVFSNSTTPGLDFLISEAVYLNIVFCRIPAFKKFSVLENMLA